MMEGAAAAVGRQQSLGTIVESSLVCYIVASDCLLLLCFCFFRPQAHWSFRCLVRGRVNRTMARNPTRLHPRRSPLCIRVTALNQHSPDLLRYTNNLLRYRPNPSTGYLITLQVRASSCTLTVVYLTLSHTHPPSRFCRRRPGEVAVHVDEVISSSTSKEAHDLRTCREHGALLARLPEVPRPSQPCSNGRALPAVRGCSSPHAQPNHRGAQQDPGPHHAEV